MRATETWQCWRDPSHVTKPHPQFGWPQCQACAAAPAYHERVDYLPANLRLTLYVPSRLNGGGAFFKDRFWVHPRSAIVGLGSGAKETVVYFEGWIHGPMQYNGRNARGLWEAGVEHAASRMVTAYPTSAMAAIPIIELQAIGTYDPITRTFDVQDEPALARWLA